jgi:hypothetical protein
MSVVAPPEPPRPDEFEALIREARARQRKRLLGTAAVIALLAGAAIGVHAIVAGGSPSTSRRRGGPAPAVKSRDACGFRGKGVRILDASGRTVYREPGHYTNPNSGRPEIRCSGATIWAVWLNGAGMMKEAYVGARSGDDGRTWRLVFSESFFGVKAPHELDAYFGPWTLRGREGAYFVGSCPACNAGTLSGTVSIWVTKDGGRTFRRYDVPALNGYGPSRMRVSGREITIVGRRFSVTLPPRKTVTVRVS